MNDGQLERDDAKTAQDYADHGATFEAAKQVFRDPFAIERLDDREDYGEDRYAIIGMVDGRALYVAYTLRNGNIRVISARGAEPMKDADTTKTTRKADKSTKTDWSCLDAMAEAQRHRAAVNDPDAQPLSGADLTRMNRTPQAKIIRRALGLSQEDFAARYHIPLGTLRDWEQGRVEPDQAARAYLKVIARAPDKVREALQPPQR